MAKNFVVLKKVRNFVTEKESLTDKPEKNMETMKRFMIDVVIENVLTAMHHSYRFLNGRFGKKVLRQPYKQIWQIVAWSLFIYFFTAKIMFPIIGWWQGIVDCMNYVIWG